MQTLPCLRTRRASRDTTFLLYREIGVINGVLGLRLGTVGLQQREPFGSQDPFSHRSRQHSSIVMESMLISQRMQAPVTEMVRI